MKYLVLILCCFGTFFKAQVDTLKVLKEDSLIIDSGKKDSVKIFKPTINDYKYQTQFSEKKIFETVLTADKTFIFSQYNNRDNFGKVQFANIGSGYNPLSFEFNNEQNLSLLPTNKSFGILGISDIRYYDVKTPTTAFIYHNAARNGAALQSTYTQNVGKNFNFAVEYYGLRSQGAYRNSLAANNNVIISSHFTSKNRRYEFFAHYIHQNVNNQEYGGIVRDDLYQSGSSDFNNPYNAQVNLENSTSKFGYRRYYFSHQFTPFNAEKLPFKIRHTIFHQGNKYYYQQDALESYFYVNQSDLLNYPLSGKKYSENLSNTVSLVFAKEKFKLDAGVRYQMIKTGVGEALQTASISIPEEIKESRIGAVGNLQINLWDKVGLKSFLEFSQGKEFGSFLKTENRITLEPVKDYILNAKLNFQTEYPSFNLLMNSSVYKAFNYRLQNPANESVLEIGGDLQLKWFKTKLSANYFRLENYTYIDENYQPQQSGSSVNISQIGGDASFSYGKFHLDAKVQFQSVLTNKDLMPLPDFIGRADLYYQTKAFKNAAEIQGGIKVYYFSKFRSRLYSPILNEFVLPDASSYEIGGQPIMDAYINMKVKSMFFFIEGQQFASKLTGDRPYTVPKYPLYGFRLNIGIVWYMFH